MKRMLIVFTALLALAITVGAQGPVTFGDMPIVNTPTPMPDGYAGLNWRGFFYVNPYAWDQAGPGFKQMPGGTAARDVVFAPYPYPGFTAFASLTWAGGSPTAPVPPGVGFQFVRAHAAAGYPTTLPGGSPLVVTAYYNGKYVGSHTYMMTTSLRQLDFPTDWGTVTQVMFQGSVVLYDVTVYAAR